MLEIFGTTISIIEIVIGIGFLIFVHELGHFIMCKVNKVKVEKFSLGFGPAIWKIKRGDTEYKLCIIPLGGYVKMAGESVVEERTGADYEFQSKTRWQRLQIYVAGSLMNIIFAFPICMVAFLAGRYVPPSTVGIPGKAELLTGIMPGDKIISVDDIKIDGLDQYRREIIRKSKNSNIKVKFQRGNELKKVIVKQSGIKWHECFPPYNVVSAVIKDSVAESVGIKVGDEIIDVDGKPIYRGGEDLHELIKNSRGKSPLKFHIKRREEDGSEIHIYLPVLPNAQKVYEIPEDKHLLEPIIGKVEDGFPAYGNLMEGDVVKKINGTDIKSCYDLEYIIERSTNQISVLEVERSGRLEKVEVKVIQNREGKGSLFTGYKKTKILADVEEGSFYYITGLRTSDEIWSIDGNIGDVFVSDLFKYEELSKEKGETIKKDMVVEVKRQCVTISIKLTPKEEVYGTRIGIVIAPQKIFRRESFASAIELGLYEPFDLGVLTFQFLYKIFAGQESVKQSLAGPVGIFSVSYMSTKLGLGTFLWVLALISISLGIFNLLPLPILDGGYLPLLLVEKIKGKPLSEKFMIIYQYIGLVLILALVIFVTFLDIGIIPRG